MTNTMVRWLEDLTGRMTAVEQRMGVIERALGLPTPVEEVRRSVVAPPPLPVVPVEILEAEIISEPPASLNVPQATREVGSDWTFRLNKARVERSKEAALESAIGKNWTSWIGAIVLVLGVMFFLKYAWDQGWLALSPTARVFTAIGVGVLFAVAGEWVRIRGMRVLAGTLAGAGVAIVMAAFLAAHSLFDEPVFSAKVAAAGVCAAALAGIWLALRMNVMTLAIIALLGAYLAPAVLRSGRDESFVLMAFLGALGVVGWSLAYLKPRWSALRWFLWACTALWLTAWMLSYIPQGQHRPLALGAVAFFFAGFMAEAFLTLHRAFRIRDENDESKSPGFTVPLENSLALMSMLTTAGAFAACFELLDGAFSGGGLIALNPTAAVAIGLACLHAMLSQATPSKQFARSSLLQAAALITIAIPLTFGQIAITAAWLLLAIALAGLSWRRENQAVRVWSVALLGLALMRLFTFDLMNLPLNTPMWTIGEQGVSAWLLMAGFAAVASHTIGWLCASASAKPSVNTTAQKPAELGVILAAIGSVTFLAATGICWQGVALTMFWLVWATALVAVAHTRQAQRFAYAPHAAVALFVIALKWLASDGLRSVVQAWDHPATDIVPLFDLGAFAGAILIALTALLREKLTEDSKPIVPVGIAVIGFAMINFETLRAVDFFAGNLADPATAKLVALSVLWAIIGLAAVVIGFAKNLRPLRYAALSLLGVTLAKILLIDLAQVLPVYRILSFLAVGILLLCVSFVYHRQTEKQTKSQVTL